MSKIKLSFGWNKWSFDVFRIGMDYDVEVVGYLQFILTIMNFSFTIKLFFHPKDNTWKKRVDY